MHMRNCVMGATMADPEGGFRGLRLGPPLPTLVFKYPMRPNYFIFMGYFWKKMRKNQQSKPPIPLYIQTPFPEILDLPLYAYGNQ